MELDNINKTQEGYPVKNLKWNERDNIIVGLVQCPLFGNLKLNDGYIVVQWRKNGLPTNNHKGRNDLRLKV
jgi:hypothetical protein